jgi:catechol 2,3-dioxygenase-like lactoylglutathione lyase family enzyme
MSHATIYVLDQDEAKEFYVGKLGFEAKTDYTAPHGFRWLSVAPKGQTEVEIALIKVGSDGSTGQSDPNDVEAIAALVRKGFFSPATFYTADCRKTFAELKAKGVEFILEPKDEFYGVVAVFKDPFGNRFSMSQPKNL